MSGCMRRLYPASRPTGVPFRIGERLLRCEGIGIKVRDRLSRNASISPPFSMLLSSVGGLVVAQGDTPLLTPGDIPPLRVVVSRRLVQIVRHPGGKVVVAEIEQSRHVVLTATPCQSAGRRGHAPPARRAHRNGHTRSMTLLTLRPSAHRKRTGLQQGVTKVPDTCRGETDTHVVEVVDVVLQVLLVKLPGTLAMSSSMCCSRCRLSPRVSTEGRCSGLISRNTMSESQRAVRHYTLELHTQAFRFVRRFSSGSAPVDSVCGERSISFAPPISSGYESSRNHAVNAAVVVFSTAVPDTEVGKAFMQELGGKNPAVALPRIVVLEYVSTVPVIAFRTVRTEAVALEPVPHRSSRCNTARSACTTTSDRA